MAADETILEEEQEALSDDLQAELEDDMSVSYTHLTLPTT